MMKKSIIVATVISLYSAEKFPKNSLRAPLLLGSLEYATKTTSTYPIIWKRKTNKSQDRANHYYVMVRLNPGDEMKNKHKFNLKKHIYLEKINSLREKKIIESKKRNLNSFIPSRFSNTTI